MFDADFKRGFELGKAYRPILLRAASKGEPVTYLYNGVRLPKLPDWDKTVYPYAFMSNKVIADVSYIMLFTINHVAEYGIMANSPSYGTCLHLSPPVSFQVYIFAYSQEDADKIAPLIGSSSTTIEANTWSHLTDESRLYEPYVEHYGAFWANHNVVNTGDGSVYLAASKPIPVYE